MGRVEEAEEFTNALKLRIFPRIKPKGECWLWMGQTDGGYGKMGIGGRHGRSQLVHRITYFMFCGEIAEGLELHHKCENKLCCRPCHLEPVTHAMNMSLSKTAMKTHCLNGHEFTEENTYIRPRGGRSCRMCKRELRIATRLTLSVLR